jgi:hypothetical protein
VTECYVCTHDAVVRVHEIPYCARCAPKPPRARPTPPAPRPTPVLHSAHPECPVLPGGFCNGTCQYHGCSASFCTC